MDYHYPQQYENQSYRNLYKNDSNANNDYMNQPYSYENASKDNYSENCMIYYDNRSFVQNYYQAPRNDFSNAQNYEQDLNVREDLPNNTKFVPIQQNDAQQIPKTDISKVSNPP